MLRLRSRLTAAVFTVLAALLTSVATAPAASASTQGWVYISTPTWLGNCQWGKDGSRVNALLMAVGNTYSSTSWDRDDDIVWAKVNLGENQQASYAAYCTKPWPGQYQPGVAQTIRPTRNGQTVWIGPAGVRYN